MSVATLPFFVEPCDSERDWLESRTHGIGASESPAAVRLDRRCSDLGLYWRKVEQRSDMGDCGPMAEAGHRHESTVASWFMEQSEHGLKSIYDPGEYTIFRSKERPYMFATCDRMVAELPIHRDSSMPLEIKCAWYDAAKEWQKKIPIAYQVQLQHQLYVTGADAGYFAVLLNGFRFKWFRMERHEKFIKRLCDKVDQLWDRIQRRDPPAADGSKSSLWSLFEMNPIGSRGKVYEVENDMESVGEEWDQLKKSITDANDRLDEIKASVQQSMTDASYARLGDGSGFSWKQCGDGRQFRRIKKVRCEDEQMG